MSFTNLYIAFGIFSVTFIGLVFGTAKSLTAKSKSLPPINSISPAFDGHRPLFTLSAHTGISFGAILIHRP